VELRLPDIGDFTDIPIIEVHVAPGDVIAAEDTVLTLESDKATMDVPSQAAGTVGEVRVSVGDRISQGDLILTFEPAGDGAGAAGDSAKERLTEEAAPAVGEPAGYGSPSGVYESVEVVVPDIGDYLDVPVIEVHVSAGDEISAEDPVVTLESDKATMEVPSPLAGTVAAVRVATGDRVSAGHPLLDLRTAPLEQAAPDAPSVQAAAPQPDRPADLHADVLVLGAGPGGYTAAFRAADLDQKVVLVDRGAALGGVCLNVGCIPSKALLHAAKVITDTAEMAAHGVSFGAPEVDVDALRKWKEGVVSRLTGGLGGLARQRKVTTVRGTGRFVGEHAMEVVGEDGGVTVVSFETAIIAAGSEPVRLPFIPHDDPRVVDSTGALELPDVPARMLVIGGGIIGLEMATVYAALGSRITIVELMDQLIPGADKDLVTPLTKRIRAQYDAIHLRTKVTAVEATPDGLRVSFDGEGVPESELFDRVLVAVGRRPSGRLVGVESAGVAVDEHGFIPVDKQMRTNVPHIFAIGDVVGQPMLAHKATHEAKVAAEAAAGRNSHFEARVIPSVAYTDPEVAWVGMTENEAKAAGVAYGKGKTPLP
jgi:dihydrolipoamide dehydrogenase